MKRCSFLLLGIFVLLAHSAGAALDDLEAEVVASGLASPVAIADRGDGRLFVTLLAGQVVILEDGAVRQRPFLDLRNRARRMDGGLWSLAFHPDHAQNGFVFVHWVEEANGDSVISRFRVKDDDADRVDPASEAEMLRIPKGEQLHYGGQLLFGPDDFLYVSTGDGTGNGNVVDPDCAAQSTASLEGKLLRLDVDQNVDTPPYYGVPAGNPFMSTGRGEIWAFGLRNPWRFSFDRATGDVWLTDVGQDRREEVNFQPASSLGGENYGWKVMEGTRCFGNQRGCAPDVPPCDDPGLTPPVIEYAHGEGRCSVIGGYVYRGSLVPDLVGRYVYADYCSGELWAASERGGRLVPELLPVSLPRITSIGEDAAGELYLMAEGTLYRLVDTGREEPASCVADANHLCLNQGRFRASVRWMTGDGASGLGEAVGLGVDSGFFWFFSANNPEVFVKVLDGCGQPSPHFWVFAAGLTDVETSLEVVDTSTGEVRRYDRPPGESYEAVRDTRAFATCP